MKKRKVLTVSLQSPLAIASADILVVVKPVTFSSAENDNETFIPLQMEMPVMFHDK